LGINVRAIAHVEKQTILLLKTGRIY